MAIVWRFGHPTIKDPTLSIGGYSALGARIELRIGVTLRASFGIAVVRCRVVARCLGGEIPLLKLVLPLLEVIRMLWPWIKSTPSTSATPIAPLVLVPSVTVEVGLITRARSAGLRLDLSTV